MYLDEIILEERIEWAWLVEVWGADSWMTGYGEVNYDRHMVARAEALQRAAEPGK